MKKTVLITGASRGIGRSIALEFAKKGYNIGINYLNSESAATDVKREALSLGVDAEIFKCDVSVMSDCETLATEFINRFGGIDVLINNAGISKISPISDFSDLDWDKMISTNLSSAFYMSKSLLPYFLRAKDGCIVNISSIWGVSGASCEVAYSTSKAGLIGFTQALAKELGPSGIRVNCVSPGIINTKMNESIDKTVIEDLVEATPLCRLGEPSDIAKTVLFLSSAEAKFITGQNIIVDGGFL